MSGIIFVLVFSILSGTSVIAQTDNPQSEDEGRNLDSRSNEFINYLNSLNIPWKAGRNFAPDVSPDYLARLCGDRDDSSNHGLEPLPQPRAYKHIPEEFDSRKQWPNCPSIGEIYHQGNCGSCWAVAAAESMSDRFCIHSNASQQFQFSAHNLLCCCNNCGNKCDGGISKAAWKYWVDNGIVSGGTYKSDKGCQPYEIAADPTAIRPPLDCVKTCKSSHNVPYEKDLRYGVKAYSIVGGAMAMQAEIMENGPIEASYIVYEDFFGYKSGVYKHKSGKKVEGHAVKIIGWGQEDNLPYWLVANSWGTEWGELGGFFKILRGSDECNIESRAVVAGIPKF